MKTAILSVATILWACVLSAAELRPDSVVHALGGPEVHFIAHRIGLHFDERGMGSFGLSRRQSCFDAYALSGSCEPIARAPHRRAKEAEQPFTLSYELPSRRVTAPTVDAWNRDWAHISAASTEGLRSTIYLEHGVTIRTVEEHIRRFMREIDAFSKQR